MKSGDLMGKTGAGGILLIGDIGTVFSDPDAADTLPCRICGNILDGIDAAARGPFSTVAVVLEGGAADFKDALKACGPAATQGLYCCHGCTPSRRCASLWVMATAGDLPTTI